MRDEVPFYDRSLDLQEFMKVAEKLDAKVPVASVYTNEYVETAAKSMP